MIASYPNQIPFVSTVLPVERCLPLVRMFLVFHHRPHISLLIKLCDGAKNEKDLSKPGQLGKILNIWVNDKYILYIYIYIYWFRRWKKDWLLIMADGVQSNSLVTFTFVVNEVSLNRNAESWRRRDRRNMLRQGTYGREQVNSNMNSIFAVWWKKICY